MSVLTRQILRRIATAACAPAWTQPTGYATQFLVHNSLTNTLVPLVVRDRDRVSWYQCGQTVYDHSHLGHAWFVSGVYVCVYVHQGVL